MLVCKHFMTRKKRFCRMHVKEGDEYCAEHRPYVESNDPEKCDLGRRISCPLDPTHTCFMNKLRRHLKRCNARQTNTPPYIEKGINWKETDTEVNRCLSNVPVEQLLQVIAKVKKVHSEILQDLVIEKFGTHPVLNDELSSSDCGNLARKHLLQTSSILALLEEFKLFQPETCYVEFGAGRGMLSYWISIALNKLTYSSSSVLLVERASPRHKYDNKTDKAVSQISRLRADIADLILSKVEVVEKSKQVVGVTKHLCGDATDLALHCVKNCQQAGKDISGVLMTFCCHHRCKWSSYTGRDFFDGIGLSKSDFDVMCGLVSWAVCGSGLSRERRINTDVSSNQHSRDLAINLSREQKEEIGKQCKDILNYGRKVYLQNCGFNSVLCYYVNRDISLENVCIVAVKENKNL